MNYLKASGRRSRPSTGWSTCSCIRRRRRASASSFYDGLRGYVINYNLGKDLVKVRERHVTSKDPVKARAQKWAAFKQLLSSPRLASGIR